MEGIKKLFQFPAPFLRVFPPVWLALFVFLVASDLTTKWLITENLNFNLMRHQVPANLSDPSKFQALQDGAHQIDILGENGKYIKFRLVFNDRFAFSIGPNWPYLGFFVSLFAVTFLFFYHWHNPELGHTSAWVLVFSGAIGNLIDKAFVKSLETREWMLSLGPQEGYVRGVVDYVECIWFGFEGIPDIFILNALAWRTWPSFNVADSCVSVGMVILIVTMWRADMKAKKEAKE